MLAAGAAAQPQSNQHGLNVASQQVYLFQTTGPEAPCAPRDIYNRLLVQAQALGLDLSDVKRPQVDESAPCAHFETWVEMMPADYAESVTGGVLDPQRTDDKVTLQRFVRDNFRKVYVRYAVTIEKLEPAGTYRVTLGDSNSPVPNDVKKEAGWRIASPARYPVPQILEDGDEIPLPLTSYEHGLILVDYIHVGRLDKMRKRQDAARDSYAEDAELTLAKPKLRVNGEAREAITFPESLRGEVMWLYVPGEGRYIVTLAPHPEFGFEKTGEVAGGLMTLIHDAGLLRIECGERIAPGGGVYNVYGVLDSKWVPADEKDRGRFMAGTLPGVETAVGR